MVDLKAKIWNLLFCAYGAESMCHMNVMRLAENDWILMVRMSCLLNSIPLLVALFILWWYWKSSFEFFPGWRFLSLSIHSLQDSTLCSCTEDYTGAIPHWMVFLLTMGMWKERTKLHWRSSLVTMMGRNRYSNYDSFFSQISIFSRQLCACTYY